MKTAGQKVGELVDALNAGSILYKQHGDPVFENKEYLFKSGDYYDIRGWGTAFGDIKDRVFEVLHSPDNWNIFPDFNVNTDEYPYPWSSKYNNKTE
jgi:hypothetical protein